jgi:VIT1/CCC1 family predicted Fe2+/Mn2+ transporter
MISFAFGAAVPVIPFLFGGGTVITILSLGLSLVGLFAVGAAVSLLTGRGLLFSGFRQLAIGLGAAVVTFLIGSLIGVGAEAVA